MHPASADPRPSADPGTGPASGLSVPPTPCVRIFSAELIFGAALEESAGALLELSFEQGGQRVRAGLLGPESRHVEREARCTLERLGAVDVECVEDLALPPDCAADYVVRVDGDANAFCGFVARAVPRLKSLGWKVEVDADFPYQVIAHDETRWYAAVKPKPAERVRAKQSPNSRRATRPEGPTARRTTGPSASEDEKSDRAPTSGPPAVEPAEKADWFGLELGVELDGKRIDLLPLIVDLLDGAEEGDGLRLLLSRLSGPHAFRVSDTHHVTVSPDRLRAMLRVVIELYQGGTPSQERRVEFPEVRAPALARLEEAFQKDGGEITWSDPTGVARRAKTVAARPRAMPGPPGLNATLRSYQEEGLAFLQHLRECHSGGVLADDMGLGKTLQTIAHLATEKAARRMELPSLVVGPTSLIGNWAREIAKFAPHLRTVILHGAGHKARWADVPSCDVAITSYGTVLRDEERFAKQPFYLLILDEAQAIKNTRTQAHRALKQIDAEHRICLTGTPIENHLGELWALFDFLNPGLLGDEVTFRRVYREPIEQRGDDERMATLRQAVSPYVIRRVKRDVAKELPPKTEILRPVTLGGKQRELYESIRVAAHADVRKLIRAKGLAASTIPILDALLKLRQVCCDPRLVQMESARQVKGSAKYDHFFELLDVLLEEGHRVLVFSQFTSMLALMAEGLRERGKGYLALTGSTRDRQQVVDAFEKRRADVFLLSLKAGGTGLNLVSADTVIHYDPWWNPAAQAQATDRAYRIGQQKPVFAYELFVAGSVEERVIQLQRRKRALFGAILGDNTESAPLSEEDVETLFAPLDDEG